MKCKPFKIALDDWLENHGGSQQDLIAGTGMKQQTISSICAGRSNGSKKSQVKIAEYIDGSYDAFLARGRDLMNKAGPSPDRRISDRRRHDNIIDLNHEKLVSQFQDKNMAYKLNEALINIERLHPSIYEEMAAYIIKTSEDLTRLRQYRPQPEHPELNRKKK